MSQPNMFMLVNYLDHQRRSRSRYEIDLQLMEVGYTPAEIDEAWAILTNPPKKHIKWTSYPLFLGLVLLFLAVSFIGYLLFTNLDKPASPPSSQELSAQLTQAVTLHDWDKAIIVGEQLLTLDKKDQAVISKVVTAYTERGVEYNHSVDSNNALKDFNRAIQLDAKDARAYNGRGNAYLHLGNTQQALAEYNLALQADPKYASAYYNKGKIYFGQKNYQQAIQDYSQAISLASNTTQTFDYATGGYTDSRAVYYYARGGAYGNFGQYNQALADYAKALQYDPNYGAVYYDRAWIYRQLGNKDAARKDYQKAIDLGVTEAQEELKTLK